MATRTPKVYISVAMTTDLAVAMDALAAERNVSIADLIRTLIRDAVDERKQ